MHKNKPTKAQRDWVKKTLETWRDRLFLQEWFVNVNYMAENTEGGKYNINAEITACPVYLRAEIRIYPHFWEQSMERREKTLIHELCHCLTQEIWETTAKIQDGHWIHTGVVRDIVERLTQRISTCIAVSY